MLKEAIFDGVYFGQYFVLERQWVRLTRNETEKSKLL